MTATLVILLFVLACLVMALLAMPASVTLAQWLEEEWPDLRTNLIFWGLFLGIPMLTAFVAYFIFV